MDEHTTTLPKFSAADVAPANLLACSSSSETQKLAAELAQRIRSESGGYVRELVVEIHADCVVLAGRAPSYYHKQLAQHAVLKHLGERQLQNRIEVVWSETAFLD